MPPDDWGQLEVISALIEDLHHRRQFAENMGNHRRAKELSHEIMVAQVQRDRLVDRITIRLAGAE